VIDCWHGEGIGEGCRTIISRRDIVSAFLTQDPVCNAELLYLSWHMWHDDEVQEATRTRI
jgi:hypothetical protein